MKKDSVQNKWSVMQIGKIYKEDSERLLEIQLDNMMEYHERHFNHTREEVLRMFQLALDECVELRNGYKIIDWEKIIGFFLLKEKVKNFLHIGELHIEEAFQGLWMWSECLLYIEELARDWSYIWVTLTVYKDNPVIWLYERKGFEIIWEKLWWTAYKMEKIF